EVLDPEGGEGVLPLEERHQVPQTVRRRRSLQVLELERTVVAQHVLPDQRPGVIEDEDPFVVDARNGFRRAWLGEKRDSSAKPFPWGGLLHATLFHLAPPFPPRVHWKIVFERLLNVPVVGGT